VRTDIVDRVDLKCEDCGYEWSINPQPLMTPGEEWLVVVCPNCQNTTALLNWRGASRYPVEGSKRGLVVRPTTFNTEGN
jgi:hypothetical protein